jgi:oligoribonuclease (3'-5' exoribonuclease)
MTQDEIIEMARQAGASADGRLWLMYSEDLEAFAKLVEDAAFKRWALQTKLAVQDEREACAVDADWCIQNHLEHLITERIRARGK